MSATITTIRRGARRDSNPLSRSGKGVVELRTTIASTPMLRAGMCSTTNTAAGRSGGRSLSSVLSGLVAPDDPPMTMMSRLATEESFSGD